MAIQRGERLSVFEIKILGRGGQGGKSLGEILSKSAVSGGKFVQAFPEYGAERTGAPVRSFVRVSNEEILIHTPIEAPDIVVVIDDTLLKNPSLIGELRRDSKIIVNTRLEPEMVKKLLNFTGEVHDIDADSIALEELGNAKHINTVLLGIIVRVSSKVFDLDEVKKEIRVKFGRKLSPEIIEHNINALMRGYKTE
ncbi:MAG: 2-oxoacid:acceptor oxidoreductase family protein [Candidatus Woesearchaeota archaeon]